MMTPEDNQSIVESPWEKTWDNFYSNLTLKYRKNKKTRETTMKNYK